MLIHERKSMISDRTARGATLTRPCSPNRPRRKFCSLGVGVERPELTIHPSRDAQWLFYVQGVALTPAVVPIGLTVCWARQSKHAAFWGTIFGTVCGMLGWFGELSRTSLFLYPFPDPLTACQWVATRSTAKLTSTTSPFLTRRSREWRSNSPPISGDLSLTLTFDFIAFSGAA